MFSTRRTASVLLLVLSGGCGQDTSGAGSAPSAAGAAGVAGAGGSGSAGGQSPGGHGGSTGIFQTVGPLLVDQLGVAHGTTAVDVHARISFGVRQNGVPEADVEPLVRKSIAVFDENGGEAPVTITRDEGTLNPQYDMLFALQPVSALAADHWHELRVTMSEKIVFRLEDPVDVSASSASVRFFTGSAPMIRKLTRYRDAGKPVLLTFELSEPVSFASFPSALQLVVDETPIEPCIAVEEGNGVGCLKDGSSIHREAFQVVLPPSTGAGDAIAIRVGVPASLQGSGRTVAEGMVVAGTAGAQVSPEGVTVVAPPKDWYACAPDATCWRTPRP